MELPSNSNADESRFAESVVCLAATSNSRNSPKAQSCVPTTTSSLQHRQQPTANSPVISKKIFSKNSNTTVVATTAPSNDAELQLYRIMQKASLLAYYDTLLEMGGDDVQQLCDAGEEEFLEIMALVGMASKPLHVRRFQKSLQEWMIDPSPFQVPLLSNNSVSESSNFQINHCISTSNSPSVMSCTKRSILESNRPIYSPSPGINDSIILPAPPSPGLSFTKSSSRSNSPLDVPSCSSSSGSGSIHLTPTLLESQILRLRCAAERISRHLPQFEPKTHGKKKVCKELEFVMAMQDDDPRRIEEIRKYAAIYGRFDCKRKPEKPLTLHEVSVNEAAAQICHFIPALLTRRDELFPLARQVVRDSGYMYSKGAIQWTRRKSEDDDDQDNEPPAKKMVTPSQMEDSGKPNSYSRDLPIQSSNSSN